MYRAYGSFFIVLHYIDRAKAQPYKISRAHGSIRLYKSSVGTRHIVATDFNPLNNEREIEFLPRKRNERLFTNSAKFDNPPCRHVSRFQIPTRSKKDLAGNLK